jgi:hypothetical protein
MANSAVRPDRSEERAPAIWTAQVVACPRCNARLTFHRDPNPQIDACGFESCRLQCTECETMLGGVVDPLDDTVLVSALPG